MRETSGTDDARRAIGIIVAAQLLAVSLWFSANGAADNLSAAWALRPADFGWLTNAVQAGFIVGTLVLSLSGLADRFAASRIFTVCACAGAAFNGAFAFGSHGLATALPLRFAVGLCMAGVYPLGMKLVVSWAPERAGAALSLLVGMLTLGTALPHGIRAVGADWPWRAVVGASSLLALVGAALVARLGDGPHLRQGDAEPASLGAVLEALRVPAYRRAAMAYFGHMWELYAFWTLVPTLVVLAGRATPHAAALSAWAFIVVGVGMPACIAGGWASQRLGSARVAGFALAASALCCALFPASLAWSRWAATGLLVLWGAAVVADSPHFSALSARACGPRIVGSALALQNAVGFAITMVSIQLGTSHVATQGAAIAWWLLPGPLIGLIALAPLWRGLPARTAGGAA
ncbi:MAG: MFS transporter [Burkholderiales bacterium]|nr:MFS transporter [Burkholderiales bacterium]